MANATAIATGHVEVVQALLSVVKQGTTTDRLDALPRLRTHTSDRAEDARADL